MKSILYSLKLLIVLLLIAAPASAVSAGDAPARVESKKIIMIGDSRAQDMHEVVGDAGCLWSFKVGSGYEWMVSTGVPAVESSIGKGAAVVIMMGVNDVVDPFRISMYASYINQKAAEWKSRGAETYYVSINPVDDSRSLTEHNSDIVFWNDTIRTILSEDVVYVDTFNLISGYFGTVDGLHYTSDTYRQIFELVVSAVDLYQADVVTFEPQEVPPDTSSIPEMIITAADTEPGTDDTGGSRWAVVGGLIRYVGEDGKLAVGLRVIGPYICYFDRYGNLGWQVHR